jgi:hypothetical protein
MLKLKPTDTRQELQDSELRSGVDLYPVVFRKGVDQSGSL